MSKLYIHTYTGEIVRCRTRLGAWLYFKADGKKYKYQTTFKQVKAIKKGAF